MTTVEKSRGRLLTYISTEGGVTTLRVYSGTRVLASMLVVDSEEGREAAEVLTTAVEQSIAPKRTPGRGRERNM